MRRLSAFVCGFLLLPVGVSWCATERLHRVRPGESASSIAKQFYGDYEVAALLLEYNGRRGNTVIHVDQQLKIPLCSEHRVRSGDTWSALAGRYLGRPDSWPAVALLNGILPERPLSIGSTIVFPVVVPHALSRGETLAVLAERYYGLPARADVLQQFNEIDDPRKLDVGEQIGIPLLAFRAAEPAQPKVEAVLPKIEPEPPKDEPVTRPEPAQPVGLAFAEPLDQLSAAIAQGRFEHARDSLDSLLDRVQTGGTPQAQSRLWEMAAALRIAFDEYDEACDAYRALHALSAEPDLDPDRVSPKIRTAYRNCTID